MKGLYDTVSRWVLPVLFILAVVLMLVASVQSAGAYPTTYILTEDAQFSFRGNTPHGTIYAGQHFMFRGNQIQVFSCDKKLKIPLLRVDPETIKYEEAQMVCP